MKSVLNVFSLPAHVWCTIRLNRRQYVCLLVGILLITVQTATNGASLPRPEKVPEIAKASDQRALTDWRNALLVEEENLARRIDAHDAKCRSVDSRDTSLVSECTRDLRDLQQAHDGYLEALADYADRIKKSTVQVQSNKVTAYTIQLNTAQGEFSIENSDGSKLTNKSIQTGRVVRIDTGTHVATGPTGRLRIILPDDTVFTLGPGSDMVIDEFVYDTNLTPKKVAVRVSKGFFRWVTGKTKAFPNLSEMKIMLPHVIGGLRGTDIETTVKPDGSGVLILHSGQLEITEKKTGSTYMLNAGHKVIFGADGSVSRPMKAD